MTRLDDALLHGCLQVPLLGAVLLVKVVLVAAVFNVSTLDL